MAQRHYSYATHKQTSQTRTQHIDLVREERVLWDEQGSEPQPRPQYGFEFILPSGLPSSFDSDSHNPGGTISYAIEVVADRHGLHFDRKVAKILSVMPIAAPEQVQAAGQLHRGWQGPWTTVEHTESVKKHIWSDDSRMEIHVSSVLWLKAVTFSFLWYTIAGVALHGIFPYRSAHTDLVVHHDLH
jgi:hypothetical protein